MFSSYLKESKIDESVKVKTLWDSPVVIDIGDFTYIYKGKYNEKLLNNMDGVRKFSSSKQPDVFDELLTHTDTMAHDWSVYKEIKY